MAKIAAIILPASQEARLTDLSERMRRSLCLYYRHRLETRTYRGDRAVCTLLRVAPDPLNTAPQPVDSNGIAGVACGYYLNAVQSAGGDSAQRLMADLAAEGVDALPRADGIYAFAYWDATRERLIAGVDKLGMRPLFWAGLPGGGYAVASEIKALVPLLDRIDTNWAAWEEHLTFGFVFGEHTFFDGVLRFGAAEAIDFRHDGMRPRTVERFLDTIDVEERPVEAFLEEQAAVFDGAMSRLAALYDARGSTMLTLSGGFDSRRALGWLLNHDIRPNAYTVPEVKRDGREFESGIVRELCRGVGIDGYSIYPPAAADLIEVRRLRDLATDFESDEHGFSAILAMGLDCDDKVNFDGLGAGSQLSGSFVKADYFEPGGDRQFAAAWPRSVRRWVRLPATQGPSLETRVQTELERWGDNPNRFAYFYLMSRTRREIALAPLSIQANVFESLCPYLDRSMMRSALSLPPLRKVGANMQMRLIEALHPQLGKIPTIYSPGVADDAQYWIHMGNDVRDARRRLLGEALGANAVATEWSSNPLQRLRFSLGRLVAALGGDRRLSWEFGKAAKVCQLGHFKQASVSPEAYQTAADALASAYGKRAGWRTRL